MSFMKDLQTSRSSSSGAELECSLWREALADNLTETWSNSCFPSPSTEDLALAAVFGLPTLRGQK